MPEDSPVLSHASITTTQPVQRIVIDLVASPVIESVPIPKGWNDAVRHGHLTTSQAALLFSLHAADPHERFRFYRVPRSYTNVIVEGIKEVDLRDLGVQVHRTTVGEAMKRFIDLKIAEHGKQRGQEFWQLFPYKVLQWRRDGRALYHRFDAPGLKHVEVLVLEQVMLHGDPHVKAELHQPTEPPSAKSDASAESDARASDSSDDGAGPLRSAGARFGISGIGINPNTDPDTQGARASGFEAGAREMGFSGSAFGSEREPGGKRWSNARGNGLQQWLLATEPYLGKTPQPLFNQHQRDKTGVLSRFQDLIWPADISLEEGRRRMAEALSLCKRAVGKDKPLAWVFRAVENFVAGVKPIEAQRSTRSMGTDPVLLVRGIVRKAKLRGEDPRGEWTVRYAGSTCGWDRETFLEFLDEFQAACEDLEEAAR